MNAVTQIRPLRIVNQIGPFLTTRLSPFGERISLVSGTRDDPEPWAVGQADILFTGPSAQWRNAPAVPPSSWGRGPAWVQVASVGVDAFPPWLLHDRIVTCGRGAAAGVIAEYVISALLVHEKRLDSLRPTSPAAWQDGVSATRRQPLGGLAGRTLGIAGFGSIGVEIARRARAFGMNVQAWRRGPWPQEDLGRATPVATLEDLVATSDALVLALPLTARTRGLIDAPLLALASPHLHFVNVARGELVDTQALVSALDAGRIGFATLDVTEPEPLPEGHPLWTHPNVRLTPHVSWSGPAVMDDLGHRIADNLSRFLDGQRLNDIVDPHRGY